MHIDIDMDLTKTRNASEFFEVNSKKVFGYSLLIGLILAIVRQNNLTDLDAQAYIINSDVFSDKEKLFLQYSTAKLFGSLIANCGLPSAEQRAMDRIVKRLEEWYPLRKVTFADVPELIELSVETMQSEEK